MLPYFTEHYGNAASRQHVFGQKAEEAVELARGQIADLIGAEARTIVFTSGATESNNLALKGVAAAYRKKGDHLISVAAEHKLGPRSAAAAGTRGLSSNDSVGGSLRPRCSGTNRSGHYRRERFWSA